MYSMVQSLKCFTSFQKIPTYEVINSDEILIITLQCRKYSHALGKALNHKWSNCFAVAKHSDCSTDPSGGSRLRLGGRAYRGRQTRIYS